MLRLARYLEGVQTTSLEDSVRASATAAAGAAPDRALLDLALSYARLIDAAAPTAALAKAIDTIAPHIPADPTTTADAWRRITTTLAEHTVASDLGPKLLAALDALLLTPRARAAAKKAVTGDQPTANPLDQLAAARARKGRAEDLDTAAP
jgi:hypothetical protein